MWQFSFNKKLEYVNDSIYDGYVVCNIRDDEKKRIVCLGKRENVIHNKNLDLKEYNNSDSSLIYLSNNQSINRLLNVNTYKYNDYVFFEDSDFKEFEYLQANKLEYLKKYQKKEFDINNLYKNYIGNKDNYVLLNEHLPVDIEPSSCIRYISITESMYKDKVNVSFYNEVYGKWFVCVGNKDGANTPKAYDREDNVREWKGYSNIRNKLVFLGHDRVKDINKYEIVMKKIEYQEKQSKDYSYNKRSSYIESKEFYMAEARNQLKTIGKIDNEKIAVKMLKAGYSDYVIKRTMYKCSLKQDFEKVCSIVNKAMKDPEIKKSMQKTNEGR